MAQARAGVVALCTLMYGRDPASGLRVRNRQRGEHFIGDVAAETKELAVCVPKDALPVVFGKAGIHGQP